MNPTIQTIQILRNRLNLQPKQDLISYLSKRINVLRSESAPDYMVQLCEKAIQHLQIEFDENTWLECLLEWVQASITEPDADKRQVYAQLGAFLMAAKI